MDHRTCIRLLLTAGQMLLESGAETYRAEDAALYMFRCIGQGEIHIFAVPTVMIVNINAEDGQSLSESRRIRKRSTNLKKIEEINRIVRLVSEGQLEPEAALSALEALDHQKTARPICNMLAMASAAGAFALLLGGGWPELIFAFIGSFLAQVAALFFRSVSMYQFFSSILGGLIPTLLMMGVSKVLPGIQSETVIVGSMLILFPGVSTVNAIRDIINGDYLSGVSRGAEALIVAFGLAVGVSIMFLPGVGI